MLYDRWRQIADACPGETALRDLASGGRWTFRELADWAERAERAERAEGGESAIVFPRGLAAEFVVSVLAAWRRRRIVCPLEHDQPVPEVRPGLPRNIVHLKTTSATTGAPRMVAFTESQLAADADQIVATMGLRREWPNIGVISLAHSYGFSNLVLPLLLHGIPLILAPAPLPELLKRAAAFEREVTLAAVPALWRTWHDAAAIPEHVRLAVSAGAPLPLALEQSVFRERGVKIHNFYGSSECGGIAYDASPTPRTDGSCAGSPMRSASLAVGNDGCLEIRGPAVGQTYWPEPSPTLHRGVFRTSDLVEISGSAVFLRGRAGDQINVAGRKVSPEMIEKALSAHPSVHECLVFGAPIADSQRSDLIVACVVSRQSVTGDALRQFLLETLPAWQVPREWWLVDSLSTTERGKVSRAEWRRRFLELTAAGENMP